jgi:superfamily II DNA or RNA helicase
VSKINLRPWQAQAIQKAEHWFLDIKEKHFLINAAPGAGKTICASVIAKRLFDREAIDRVIVIAPRREVVRQWGEDFRTITGHEMTKVTGADGDVDDYGNDLCATWAAIQALSEPFQYICQNYRTLVICDEHHHAAVEAAWGSGAGSAFADAKYVLILTGTPIRSDGKETVWFLYDQNGRIDHPADGMFTLSYGQAVDRGYCRPITFHRHEGHFTVTLPDGEGISVSSQSRGEVDSRYRDIPGLQRALDFYKLACSPKYQADGETPDPASFLGSMLDWGIAKLDDLRETTPTAGGLVVAPSIAIAEHMAGLLEQMTGERPTIVHNQTPNAEARIRSFRNNSDKKWLVSVAMISEGVDIPRLRILVYLPYARTELAFRQCMGRVVRSLGEQDLSRAYVVMPSLELLEEFARRVEEEMSPEARSESPPTFKVCPVCEAHVSRDAAACAECGHEFPPRATKYKTCAECEKLNPPSAVECQHCGAKFGSEFEIALRDALRVGAIIRGMDLEEEDVLESEDMADDFRDFVLASGDDFLIKIMRDVPLEAISKLAKFAEARRRREES